MAPLAGLVFGRGAMFLGIGAFALASAAVGLVGARVFARTSIQSEQKEEAS
jgi:hypothetical protein